MLKKKTKTGRQQWNNFLKSNRFKMHSTMLFLFSFCLELLKTSPDQHQLLGLTFQKSRFKLNVLFWVLKWNHLVQRKTSEKLISGCLSVSHSLSLTNDLGIGCLVNPKFLLWYVFKTSFSPTLVEVGKQYSRLSFQLLRAQLWWFWGNR